MKKTLHAYIKTEYPSFFMALDTMPRDHPYIKLNMLRRIIRRLYPHLSREEQIKWSVQLLLNENQGG